MPRQINLRFRAFTIVELLVVIAIIMILAGMLFPAFQMMRDRSRKEESKAILGKIDAALRQYENDTGHYPWACNDWDEGSWLKDDGTVENGELVYAALDGGDYLEGDLTATTVYEDAPDSTETADNKIFIDGWKKPVIYIYVANAHASKLGDTDVLKAAWWGRANKVAGSTTGATHNAPKPKSGFRKEFELWSAGPDKEYLLSSDDAGVRNSNSKETDNVTVTGWE